MNISKYEPIAKLGLSLTTLATVFLFFIGKVYYLGFFTALGVPVWFVSINFLDILDLNFQTILVIYLFVVGYISAIDIRDIDKKFDQLFPDETEIMSQKQKQKEDLKVSQQNLSFEKLSDENIPKLSNKEFYIFFLLGILSFFIYGYYLFQGDYYQLLVLIIPNLWGYCLYSLLKTKVRYFRVLLIYTTVFGFLVHAFITGILAADSQNTLVNVTVNNDVKYENALLVYQSSEAIVLIPSTNKDVIRIPQSEIKHMSTEIVR